MEHIKNPKYMRARVSALVNFLNLDSDDPNDMSIAGVDIFRFNPDVKIVELIIPNLDKRSLKLNFAQ
jgi:hypothetical protein